ncbi:MAG: sigma 54-interacting transcriptional regulator [Acidiferrobacter sp.]
MQEQRILVVDDSRMLRGRLEEGLASAGLTVRTAKNAVDALALLPRWPADMVVSGLEWNAGGMALCAGINETRVRPALIVLVPESDSCARGNALGAGADVVRRPTDTGAVSALVSQVTQTLSEADDGMLVVEDHSQKATALHGLRGQGSAMRKLAEMIRQVARAKAPVLVTGASGTGKELAARAIHAESDRRDHPFVAVNCAGIPESLWESEFFGYEAGAFSGASKARGGLFAAADGGTLFLDEIGEMPLGGQAKLLRVLEGGWVRPVGSTRERSVDVRIIAATHRDLVEVAEGGRFRHDLFYRLEVLTLAMPALAERSEDIEILAWHFLEQYKDDLACSAVGFSGDALHALRRYAYPGNVRELRNIVQWALTFCQGNRITEEDLPPRVRRCRGRVALEESNVGSQEERGDKIFVSLRERQRAYVHEVLMQVGGNKRRAAKILGIGRRTLYRWLAE